MLRSLVTFRRKVRRCFNHFDTSGLHSCNKRNRASMAHEGHTCSRSRAFTKCGLLMKSNHNLSTHFLNHIVSNEDRVRPLRTGCATRQTQAKKKAKEIDRDG